MSSPADGGSYRANKPKIDHKLSRLKPKDLCLIPFRLAIALQEAGWYVRSDIIWAKPNPMPESCRDRPTKSHEYVFLLAKSERYYFDQEAVKEPAKRPAKKVPAGWDTGEGNHRQKTGRYAKNGSTAFGAQGKQRKRPGGAANDGSRDMSTVGVGLTRNIRTVWTIATRPFHEAHFAVFPGKLVEPCIKAGCPEGGVVLDPFMGAGTVAVVARKLGCRFVGAEMNEEYIAIAKGRLRQGWLAESTGDDEAQNSFEG